MADHVVVLTTMQSQGVHCAVVPHTRMFALSTDARTDNVHNARPRPETAARPNILSQSICAVSWSVYRASTRDLPLYLVSRPSVDPYIKR